jgi:predicted glycosyltransferase involved in capsule biosynthesis
MKKFTDVTFTIPVKADSMSRILNLATVLRYLTSHFQTNIMVAEQGSSSVLPQYLGNLADKIDYIFIQEESEYFHKTRLLNKMALKSDTRYLCSYDADVIAFPAKLISAYELLECDAADMCFPYEGKVLNIERNEIDSFYSHMDPTKLNTEIMKTLYPNVYGGALLMKREAFFEGGMENEKFINWGGEDDERVTRFSKLGYRISRVAGPLLHLDHYRGENIGTENPNYTINVSEYEKILNMEIDQLRAYISSWVWMN